MTNGGSATNLMDQWSDVSAPAAAPPQPEQLQADLQQQMASGVQPRLELQLGPQEMPVRVAAHCSFVSISAAGWGQEQLLFQVCKSLLWLTTLQRVSSAASYSALLCSACAWSMPKPSLGRWLSF